MNDKFSSRPLRGVKLLVAKPGLDGHDSGAKVIVLALRDAGAEVIYTGLRRSPDYIVRVALDEDVDAVGLSILSGGHLELVKAIIDGIAAGGGADKKLFLGGTIPLSDYPKLREMGVADIFSSEDSLSNVITRLADILKQRTEAGGGVKVMEKS